MIRTPLLNKLVSLLELHFVNRDQIFRVAMAPKWDEAGRVHDWRKYIAEEIREIWVDLPIEANYVAMIMAGEQADSEEWE